MADRFAALTDLPGVAEAAADARARVDALLWDRGVRARMAAVVADSRLQGAWASAALEGAELPPAAVRDGSALDASPMGRVLSGALRLQDELPRLVPAFERAPAQAWARLHAVAGHGLVPQDELGRPRRAMRLDDPLRLGEVAAPVEVAARLESLASLLVAPTEAPAVVVASVVHGELLTLRPFGWGSGLVARAGLRLVLAARGVDPDGATVPEAGLLALGRPTYRSAALRYQEGTADGVGAWIVLCCRAIADGAGATPDPRTAPGGAPLRGTSSE